MREATESVCAECLGDEDLKAWIISIGGPPGCDFCGGSDSPTCNLTDLCDRIHDYLSRYWGSAVDQLPYVSAEGGYQGATWDTEDILFDEVGLELPRDKRDRLRSSIIWAMADEVWCDFDWGSLELDEALWTSWERFCGIVMHDRRFFFHTSGSDDRDSYTPASLLETIARIGERMGILSELPSDTDLWRARPRHSLGAGTNAADFGPPPKEIALQSNRMNPPGIPMLYLASSPRTSLAEARTKRAPVGHWRSRRPLKILDLRTLPPVPGFFSEAPKSRRLALLFLYRFARDIMKPVARDERNHIDYLPAQVTTEFFRDFAFEAGRIDGIAYGSTVDATGWNVVLFAGRVDLGIDEPRWSRKTEPWLQFEGARLRSIR